MMAFENFLRNVPQQTLHQATSAFGGGTTATATAGGARRPDPATSSAKPRRRRVEKAKPVRTGPKVGRNDPCPCGSGKKYKHCCGR